MRIGLLTHTPGDNYGGVLQAVALYSYLTNANHDVMLINKVHKFPLWKRVATSLLEKIPFQNFRNKRYSAIKRAKLRPFIRKHLPLTSSPIVTLLELKELVIKHRFDAVIVGSDQVWRYHYINDGNFEVYFLDYEVDFQSKKIAYAASFGVSEWEEPNNIDVVTAALAKFDAVSVREEQGRSICEKTFNLSKCECVLDPTMLVETVFYDQFLSQFKKINTNRKLVTYILDKSRKKKKIINSIKMMYGEKDNEAYLETDLSFAGSKSAYSVNDWLWHIKTADVVVTDSFHGVVFSILFKKDFYVIGNMQRGIDRIANVLASFGIEGRLLINFEDLDFERPAPIDYQRIHSSINRRRHMSETFLRDALLVSTQN